MVKIAIIGIGNWGQNLVRNFLKHPAVDKVYCYDVDRKRLASVQREFPRIETVIDFQKILNNSLIDAAVIATPVSSHFELAQQVLESNKHVLVEKPLTSNEHEATILINLARKKRLKLMVDHVSVYHGAIKKIKRIIGSGAVGKIMYLEATRTSQGLNQSGINVIWDLAIHDLSILDYLFKERPKAISAVGMAHFSKLEDIAHIILFFNRNWLAHLHVNWLSPIKVRRILIGGTKKTVVFDDTKPSEKITIYDQSYVKSLRPKNKVFYPKYDNAEPLASVTNEFIKAIQQNHEPLTNGANGLKIIKILTAAEKSMKRRGAIVELN